MNIKLFLLSLLIVNVGFGMEDSEKKVEETSMTKIGHWRKMVPFEGRIIAYQTDSLYFGKNSYHIHGREGLMKVGLVSTFPWQWGNDREGFQEGYNLYPLILKNRFYRFRALINDKLSGHNLSVRLVTTEEIAKIYEAIKNNEARFAWYRDGEEDEIRDLRNFINKRN